MEFCTHIPIRPRKQCHFKMFKAASWWRYNRHIPLVSTGACLWTANLRRRTIAKLCTHTPFLSLGPFTAPPTGGFVQNTFLDSTPQILREGELQKWHLPCAVSKMACTVSKTEHVPFPKWHVPFQNGMCHFQIAQIGRQYLYSQ